MGTFESALRRWMNWEPVILNEISQKEKNELCIYFLILNWRRITLLCCVGFCHTAAWSSHWLAYVPSLLTPPLTPSHPSRLSQSTGFEPVPPAADSHWLSILHMGMGCVSVSLLRPSPLPLLPPLLWFYTWEWGVSVSLFPVRLPPLSFHHCSALCVRFSMAAMQNE